VAAAVISKAGLAWCFAINAASYLVVLIGLALIRLPMATPLATGSPWKAMKEGVRHVLDDHRLRGLVEVIAVFSTLATPVLALMPVLAKSQLRLDAGGYGLMLSAVGVGGLAGALALAASKPTTPRGRIVILSQFACAGFLLILSFSRSPLLAYVVLGGIGFTLIVNAALGNTILQTLVPDVYRGRLMSIYSLIVVGVPQVISAPLAGAVAQRTSISITLGASAVLMVLYTLWVSRRYPELGSL
jgi:MFS family permease